MFETIMLSGTGSPARRARLALVLACVATIPLLRARAFAQNEPELPRVFLDTTYSPPTRGSWWRPLRGADDRPTRIAIAERTDDAVLDAAESRAADAVGRRTDSAARPAGATAADDGLLPFRLEIATFCSAVRTGQGLKCGVEMAFKTTVACLAANRAMDTRQRVEIPQRP